MGVLKITLGISGGVKRRPLNAVVRHWHEITA
jgi:hypothetical protein